MSDSNNPKVLIEFEPEEISWLADLLHEEWNRIVQASAIVSSPDLQEKIQKHKAMESTLRNRLLNKAAEQGFGNL